jgi:hypothetical protein
LLCKSIELEKFRIEKSFILENIKLERGRIWMTGNENECILKGGGTRPLTFIFFENNWISSVIQNILSNAFLQITIKNTCLNCNWNV